MEDADKNKNSGNDFRSNNKYDNQKKFDKYPKQETKPVKKHQPFKKAFAGLLDDKKEKTKNNPNKNINPGQVVKLEK